MRKDANASDSLMIDAMRRVGRVADDLGLPFLVIGATARMLLLERIHGLESGRRTLDVDYGVAVGSWDDDMRLRAMLVESGDFAPDSQRSQRMHFRNTVTVDIIPFGGVENEHAEIEWPGDDGVLLNVLGLADLLPSAIPVDVGDGLHVPIISPEGLLVSKLVAWQERGKSEPGRDVTDIGYVLRNAERIIGMEKLYEDHLSILVEADYRTGVAAAQVLAVRLTAQLRSSVREQLQQRVDTQLHEDSELVRDLRKHAGFNDASQALALLEGFARGLTNK